MCKKLLWCLVVCLLFLPAGVFALEVGEIVITTAIIDREPMDSVEVFPRQNGKLYCFTRILGAEDETSVYHLWYQGDQLMSKVELPVRSPNWRTWSAKQLREDWPGMWRVEIQDKQGNFLSEISFELR